MFNYSKYIKEENAKIVPVKLPGVTKNIKVFMKRTELVHPIISGNKWYKMKYNIDEMLKQKKDTLLTFGGAFSNHIHATAEAGKLFGFKTIGIIRGEEYEPLNITLQHAKKNGLELHYINRTKFRERDTKEFIDELKDKFGDVYILPLGGTNTIALKGCAEIVETVDIDFDYICSASGSGGTFAGIVAGLDGKQKGIVFPALKGGEFLKKIIENLVYNYTGKRYNNWEINTDYHFGGFAKLTTELVNFTTEFEKLNGFPLDYIYTNKMMYGIADLIQKGFFNEGEKIIAVHSGGLQGNEGMKSRFNSLLK
jgi:1-aminocyclopropane-1-carboxylate deaminase/D-cysteine desulfhydrase-like pyridoxal-dependent ACC family enzyme